MTADSAFVQQRKRNRKLQRLKEQGLKSQQEGPSKNVLIHGIS